MWLQQSRLANIISTIMIASGDSELDNLNWLESFPPLLALELNAREILIKSARIVEAPIGTIGYREGGACGAYVMRLAG